MKIKFPYILVTIITLAAIACKKDNYEEPAAQLSGKLVYKGEPIGVERNQVPYELYQYGFGKIGPIRATFAQDGSYSALLFNGDYKLIIPNGQGPFLWKKTSTGAPDSLNITVNGSQTKDLEVMPYYMIRNAQINGSSGKVTSTCTVEKIITDANAKDIESVSLYINKTQFVSPADNIANTTVAGAAITDPANISLSVTVPAIVPAQNYVFARIGLKIAGVEDRIFSPLVKVQF